MYTLTITTTTTETTETFTDRDEAVTAYNQAAWQKMIAQDKAITAVRLTEAGTTLAEQN